MNSILAFSETFTFRGENIFIIKHTENYNYSISSGVLHSSKGYDIIGKDFFIRTDKKDYKISTAKKILYKDKKKNYNVIAQGIDYDSKAGTGELFPPVKVLWKDGTINSKTTVFIRDNKLYSKKEIEYIGKKGEKGKGLDWDFDGNILNIYENFKFVNKNNEFQGKRGEYDTKNGLLNIFDGGSAKLKKGEIFFDNGVYNIKTNEIRLSKPLFKGKLDISGGIFKGYIKNNDISDFTISQKPVVSNNKIKIRCNEINSKNGLIRFVDKPEIEIQNNTNTITLFPKELFLDRSENKLYCKKTIHGYDKDGNQYFGRDFVLNSDGNYTLNKGFYYYNPDFLLSSEKMEGNSKSFSLEHDGYFYYAKDGSEFFFCESHMEDIKKNMIYIPKGNFKKGDATGYAEEIYLKYDKKEKHIKGVNLKFLSKENKTYIEAPKFKIFNDDIIFPKKVKILTFNNTPSFTIDKKDIKNKIIADSGMYDTKKRVMIGKNIRTKEKYWFIRGELVVVKDNNTLYIKNAKITTCELEIPHYYFLVKKLKIIKNDKLILKSAFLTLGKLPILYLPFYIRDINPDDNFLVTYIGRDNYTGYFIKNRILIRPKIKNMKLKFNLLFDYMTETDIGAGLTGKYSNKFGRGNLFYYFNRDFNNIFVKNSDYKDLEKIQFNMNQNIKGYKIIARIDHSNSNYVNHYFDQFENEINQKEFSTEVNLSKAFFKKLNLNLGYYKRNYNYETYSTETEILPKMNFNLSSINLKIFAISMNGSYNLQK
ncbi:hypothetical protein J7L48_08700, partial [bacterium]|nr:hypothetical protein [bacterium]